MIDAKTIAQLRRQTGAGILNCRKALEESEGDYDKAIEILRKQGEKAAAKRQERNTGEGLVHSYIHGNGKTGVLVKILCETDFVARNEQFQQFVHDIALHIAAMQPLYVSKEDVPDEVINKEKEIYAELMADENKPADIADKIIEGKLAKYYEDVVLMNQKFIKDDTMTIEEVVKQQIAKTGENIQIKDFSLFII